MAKKEHKEKVGSSSRLLLVSLLQLNVSATVAVVFRVVTVVVVIILHSLYSHVFVIRAAILTIPDS